MATVNTTVRLAAEVAAAANAREEAFANEIKPTVLALLQEAVDNSVKITRAAQARRTGR
jgi:hypothetical protein